MNIQQFQYVLAVAQYKHFETAAAHCFISQSTLSTMISRLEDELGLQLFDRKTKPVSITNDGKLIIDQLKIIMADIGQLEEQVNEIKGEVKGRLRIAVIPTIAPFLLPLFLQNFAARFPGLHIQVKEQTTPEILRLIKSRDLDIGILSIPLSDPDLKTIPLYHEPFVYFDAAQTNNCSVSLSELALEDLYLLEEGHCLRTQVLKLCDVQREAGLSKLNFEYKAGSIDSLLRFVKANSAATLIPFLATIGMPIEDAAHIRPFAPSVPYRTVGMVVHRHFVKKHVLNLLEEAIRSSVEYRLPVVANQYKMVSPV
jgi:LysR family transcriptional regulator, hydrogen peroxide-inducible genes activator